jgi:exosortase H (IPTLxxWG-CTERM-specific)
VGGALLLSTRLQDGLLSSLSVLVTTISEGGLRMLGVDVIRSDTTLVAPNLGFGMGIHNDCNGAWAHLVFLAAVLAFPAGWRAKLIGLAVGEALLFALNIFRVISLFLIGVYAPSLFRAAHVYVWQFLIIGCALLLFTVWVDKVVRRPA